jgi:hypothetical protein
VTRLDLPDPPKIRGTNFRLQRIQAFNPLRGGHHQAVDMGEPVWLCDIETTPLSRAQGGLYKSLLAKLRGALRTLMLWDVSRPRPLAYASSTESYVRIGRGVRIGEARRIGGVVRAWGSPRIVEVDRVNSRIRIEGFDAGADITEGDYAAWDDGPTRRLYIVVEDAEADGLGQAWLTVEPAPPSSSGNLPAALEMHRAAGEFVVLQASMPYSAPVTHQLTLQAAQVLRRS